MKSRNLPQSIQEMAFPVYLVAILVILSFAFPPQILPPVTYFETINLESSRSSRIYQLALAYSPKDSQEVSQLVNAVAIKLNITNIIGMSNQEEINNFYDSNPLALGFGLSFNVNSENQINVNEPFVTISANGTFIPSTSNLINSQAFCRGKSLCPATSYIDSGFLLLQRTIDQVFFEQRTGWTNVSVNFEIQQMPKPTFKNPNGTLSTIAAIYVVWAFSPIVQFLLTIVVGEKESKIKEGMIMMGLSNSALISSWFLTYSIVVLISSLIMTILSFFGNVVPNANFFVIFLLLFLYGLSTIAYSFILIPFFHKAKVAGAVGSLFSAIISVVYVPLFYSNPSATVKWLCCLVSPIALALGFGEAVFLESLGEGATFKNIRNGNITPGFSISSTLIMLVVDIFLYLSISWYLEYVIPNEYGRSLPAWFLFTKEFWFPSGKSEALNDLPMSENENIEIDLSLNNLTVGIQVSNISKEFESPSKEKVLALDSISLKLYMGQIFGLLGHNGAGKTTLVSIMSGLFKANSGSIHILGLETTSNTKEIRSNMGVCPQQNIIFDDLTVKEHIEFYASLKGVNKIDVDRQVQETLSKIDLVGKENTKSKALSGGQKRKLCVGIAIVGNPTVIFLDEPTSGMDPYSRRKIWDLLQAEKKDKIILLTTHFMDEADILADRKAILSKGRIKCLGSSLFLKNRFGLGYHLNISLSNEDQREEVEKAVKTRIPEAQLLESSLEEKYLVPRQSIEQFPFLLDDLEKIKGKVINHYSVTMTSLEEVFIRLQDQEGEHNPKKTGQEENKEGIPIEITQASKKDLSILDHTRIISSSRMTEVLRNKKRFIFSVAIPIVFLIIALVIYRVVPVNSLDTKELLLGTEIYEEKLKMVPFVNTSNANLESLFKKTTISFSEQYESDEQLYSSLLQTEDQGRGLSASISFSKYTKTELSLKIIHNDTSVHLLPVLVSEFTGNMFSTIYESIGVPDFKFKFNSLPLPTGETSFSARDYVAILMIGVALNSAASPIAPEVVKEKEKKIKHQLTVMGLPTLSYWLSLFQRDILLYFIPYSLVLILVWAFSLSGLIGNAFLPFFLLSFFYVLMMTLFSYCVSFLFTSYENCQSYYPPLLNIISSVPYYFIGVIDLEGYRTTSRAIHYAMMVVNPGYGIFGGLHYINTLQVIANFSKRTLTMDDYFKVENVILPTILIVFFQIPLFGFIIYLHESKIFNKKEKPRKTISIENLDEDVIHESQIAHEKKDVPIRVTDLVKIFEEIDKSKEGLCQKTKKEKVAVNGVSFVVSQGECLGMLGPNGAGKTTTLSILTCEMNTTSGSAYISGHDVSKEKDKIYQKFAYCPQFDALFEDLSLKQHLLLYAQIKGMDKSDANQLANQVMEIMEIKEHSSKSPRHMSGGTKRKLSFAITIIGQPETLILDEPSTGMDPSTRRHMWEVIKQQKSGRSIILTTHSMEEADALCTRIAIFVNGQIRCIGTSGRLKHKFGEGYILDVKTHPDQIKNVKSFIESNFTCHMAEEYGSRVQYSIKDEQLNISRVFSLFEQNKSSLMIEDYSFSQTTLEQVFISFAKLQDLNDASQ